MILCIISVNSRVEDNILISPLCYVHNIYILEMGRHWWFDYPGSLLDVELEFTCLLG